MYSSLGKVFSNVKEFYNEINGATLTGAIDVVVVEQLDGSFTCSPFHVRFGKLGVLRSKLKIVDLELNGEPLNIHMKLGESGEAFFVEEIPADEMETSAHLATSPIPDNGFPLFQEQMLLPRRNSDDYPMENYQNQVSDFSHRRYTDGQNSIKPSNTAQKLEYQIMNNQFVYNFNPSQINQDQEVFVMDDLPTNQPNNVGPASPTVKMFRAEEVKEEESRAKEVVRKISINNDFRPISIEKEQPSIPSICEVKSIDVAPQQIVEEVPKTQNNGSNKKKKKTKKSGSKKKNSLTRKLSNNTPNFDSSQSEIVIADDDVEFAMALKKSYDTIKSEQLEDKELLKNASFPVNNLIQDHFYSNPDVRTTEFDFKDIRRNNGSRPGTPVQSDSELELARGSGVQGNNEPGQSWRWGELPSPLPTTKSSLSLTQPPATESLSSDDEPSKSQIKDETSINVASQTSGPSGSSGMFSFMKHFRGATHANAQNEAGVYLAELEGGAIEPEVAALYFPSHTQPNSIQHNVPRSLPMNISSNIEHATEEDYESGNGPSLPQSPSSVDGLMGKGLDSDEDDIKIFCKGYVGLSLCGPQCLSQPPSALNEAFEQDAVQFEMLCTEPDLVHDPRLVVRIGNKFMPWVRGAPIILSLIVYHRPLPKNVFQNLTDGNEVSAIIKSGDISQSAESKSQQRSTGFTWWNWRRSAEKQTHDESALKSETDVDGKTISTSYKSFDEKNNITNDIKDSIESKSDELETLEAVTASTQTSFPILTGIVGGYSGSQSSEDSDEGITDKDLPSETSTSQIKSQSSKQSDKFRKTLRLSSEEIAGLDLREGMNEMVFSVTTAYQGTSRCKCHVFRWRYDDKIVISDIDGTITKSDVLGHIFPLMGKDWAQNGVAQLFTKIKNNGYKLLYLSARAIGQAKGTREYLRSIKQGNLSLPDGPLLLNPTSLLRAFHREVIEKKPEEFKIQCLSDIKALYPEGSKPFYAGYGNRINDVCAYQTVGIPIVRIFTINHKGELKHELTQTFQSSYSNMSFIVDHLYPPVHGDASEDFSQFAYWRQPIADLNDISSVGVSPNLAVIPENASN